MRDASPVRHPGAPRGIAGVGYPEIRIRATAGTRGACRAVRPSTDRSQAQPLPAAQRIGLSPAPKAVKIRVSRLRHPRLTSGKSPTGS
jgi:hypothetical protein